MAINRDDWLKAVTEVGGILEEDQEAITIAEFAAMFGLSEVTASRALDKLARSQRAVRTRKLSTRRDGRRLVRVAYRLLDLPTTQKRKR